MLKVVTQIVEVDIDDQDMIVPGDAAREAGRSVQNIMNLMTTGTLPTYLLPGDQRLRPQKFTSRKALAEFSARRTERRSKKRK